MPHTALKTEPPTQADIAYQNRMLEKVSRTFALTIPELPEALRLSVGNAYLLCRIADTIEDAPGLPLEDIRGAHAVFWNDLNSESGDCRLCENFLPVLKGKCTEAEYELVENSARVLKITRSLSQVEREAMLRCVSIMTEGMQKFRAKAPGEGVRDMAELDAYCYCVAGVVGEMLSSLFCAYSQEIAEHAEELQRLSVSFGEGLQLVNILKDIWDDKERSVCWLPEDLFLRHGYDLRRRDALGSTPEFGEAILEMVGIAHGHLEKALDYTLLIPESESGIRRFCLYSIGLALFTLRNINANPRYKNAGEVKISRSTVYAVVGATRAICESNFLLEKAFALCAAGLPKR